MIKPVSFNLELYQKATFSFSFRIKECGAYVDPSLWQINFRASDAPDGTLVFNKNNYDSPNAGIAVDADDDFLITVTVPAGQTNVSQDQLYYEVDTTPPSGEVQRRMIGNIAVFRNAEGS